MLSATGSTKHHLQLLVTLAAAIAITGCNAMNLSTPTTSATPNLTGYWQFQNPQSNPAGAIMLQGAMQSQGSQVTGIFNSSMGCSPPVVDLSGTIDPTGNLALTGLYAQAQLMVPANPISMSGTAGGGGYLCQALWAGPVTAVKVATAPSASLTGTFAGSIIPANATTPIANLSVTLTQSTTADATGQFPLTGTLTYATGTCIATFLHISGTLTGFQVMLAAAANPPAGPVGLVAATNPAASQLLAGDILFFPNPCSTTIPSSDYSGVLTRQ